MTSVIHDLSESARITSEPWTLRTLRLVISQGRPCLQPIATMRFCLTLRITSGDVDSSGTQGLDAKKKLNGSNVDTVLTRETTGMELPFLTLDQLIHTDFPCGLGIRRVLIRRGLS